MKSKNDGFAQLLVGKYYVLTLTGLRMLPADEAAKLIVEALKVRNDFTIDDYRNIAFHANVQQCEKDETQLGED